MTQRDLLTASAIETEGFTLEILTPLFMHGNRKNLEVRVPSIKGVLRYWWRTLQDSPSKKLIKQETAKFGGITGDQGCRSPVRFRLELSETKMDSSPLLPHRSSKKGYSPAIGAHQSLRLLMVHLKRDAEFAGEDGLTLKEEHSLYVRWMLLLSGFGQRARRGAGAVQYEGFQWRTSSDIQNTLRDLLTRLKRDGTFQFPPPESGCLLRRKEKPQNIHPQINAVWVGEPSPSAEKVRERISRAGHRANSGGGLLGSSKPRFASPLHCTVRRVGQGYVPVITEVTSRDMDKDHYRDARNRFLQILGVNA